MFLKRSPCELFEARTKIEQIDAQIGLIQQLQRYLTPDILSHFAISQPHGIYSDEYLTIKKLKDSDPLNVKIQENCRLGDYPAYVEETIPEYNANIIKGYIVCEGPDPEKKDSMEQFIASIFMNKRHAAVNTIIVSGMPNDHFAKPFEHMLNYANYIPDQPGKRIVMFGGYTVLRKQPTDNRSTPGIEHICLEINHRQNGVIVSKQLEIFRFVKNPDLKRAQITETDMTLLLDIALRNPSRIAFHCGAGLSRSVSKLLTFIIFNKLINNMPQFVKGESIDTESFLNYVADEYRKIRIHRPGVLGNNDLLIEAITLAIQLSTVQLKSNKEKLNFDIREAQSVDTRRTSKYCIQSRA